MEVFYAGRLLYSFSDFDAVNPEFDLQYSLQSVSSMNRRRNYDYGFATALGFRYNIGQGYLNANIMYLYSMVSITDPANRYNNPELLYAYYYLDDDIHLHNLSFSIGYSIILDYKVIRK